MTNQQCQQINRKNINSFQKKINKNLKMLKQMKQMEQMEQMKQMKQTSQSFSTNGSVSQTQYFQTTIFNKWNKQSNHTSNNDLNTFQQSLLSMQQQIIRQQIMQLQSKNIQKRFPSLLHQLKDKSSTLINLQKEFSSVKQKNSKQVFKINEQAQTLQEQITKMRSNKLPQVEQEDLKQVYEKQLIFGLIDSFQYRIKQLNAQSKQLSQEGTIILQDKKSFQTQIELEKHKIINLAIAKSKLEEEINYLKNCEIYPIRSAYLKKLQVFKQKSLQFRTYFNDSNLKQGTQKQISRQNPRIYQHQQFYSQYQTQQKSIIQRDCQLYDLLTKTEMENYDNTENHYLQEHISQCNKLQILQKRLNKLTQLKLAKNSQLSLEQTRRKCIQQQIIQKQKHIQKYYSLFNYIQAQPFHVQSLSIKGQTYYEQQTAHIQVTSTKQLYEMVNKQKNQNKQLKLKFESLVQKLEIHKQLNKQLKMQLTQEIKSNQISFNNLYIENSILKKNLQLKKDIYQGNVYKNASNENPKQARHVNINEQRKLIDNSNKTVQIQKNNYIYKQSQIKNYLLQQPRPIFKQISHLNESTYKKQLTSSFNHRKSISQLDNNLNQHLIKSNQSQTLNSRLLQLKKRLSAKFQSQNLTKKIA